MNRNDNTAAQGAVLEGWRLVPVEPTPEMVAAIPWPTNVTPTLGLDCYGAMLAAAPQAPAAAAGPRPQADAGAPMTHAEAAAAIGITSAIHRIESGDAQGALEPLREAARVLFAAAPQAPAAAVAPADNIKRAAEAIAVKVAKNCGGVPQLTFPHIYLGLKDLLAAAPTQEAEDAAQHNFNIIHAFDNWLLEQGHYVCRYTEDADGDMAPMLNWIASVNAMLDAARARQEGGA